MVVGLVALEVALAEHRPDAHCNGQALDYDFTTAFLRTFNRNST